MAIEPITGSRVAVEANFRLAGVATDPVAVTAVVRSPGGDTESFGYPTTITRDVTGVYRLEFTATQPGPWAVRFEGSGVLEAVNETTIQVRPSAVL